MQKEGLNTKLKNITNTVGVAIHSNQQKGITLIALIITIIVMLILVGVTINVALNGGIFGKAKDAAKLTQIEADREELLLAVVVAIGTDGKVDFDYLDKNLPNNKWTGSNGTYTSPKNNTFVVDANGKITYKENGGESNPNTPTGDIPDDLERYVLGANKTGRPLTDIMNMGSMSFIDDSTTEEVDETQTLGVGVLQRAVNENGTKGFLYAKYDEKAYKIVWDAATNNTEKLELIYTPKGNEGRTTAEGWTILYDNGATVEAVSPTVMGELRLGYSEGTTDSEQQLTEAIESYNGAIGTINTYCKELEGLPSNSGVRSVGASSDTGGYYNGIPTDWPGASTYNGKGKAGDTNYEQDLVRMSYWGVNNVGEYYWMASRCAVSAVGMALMNVRSVNTGGSVVTSVLWQVHASGAGSGRGYGLAVRPVITVRNLQS